MNSNCCKVQHNIPYGPLKHGNITKTAEMAFKFGKHAMFDPNFIRSLISFKTKRENSKM